MVDDEHDIVLIIEQMLAPLSVEVHSFTNPVKALDYFRQNSQQISMVISDYRMPQMSGLDFIKSIRELNKTVKVIVISAFEPTRREIDSARVELNVDAIVTKPFGIEKLVSVICDQLGVRS